MVKKSNAKSIEVTIKRREPSRDIILFEPTVFSCMMVTVHQTYTTVVLKIKVAVSRTEIGGTRH